MMTLVKMPVANADVLSAEQLNTQSSPMMLMRSCGLIGRCYVLKERFIGVMSLKVREINRDRPSNLSVVSTLLERLVASQLLSYLNCNNLLPENQSAYSANHSTKTVTTKIISDILMAFDHGEITALADYATESCSTPEFTHYTVCSNPDL